MYEYVRTCIRGGGQELAPHWPDSMSSSRVEHLEFDEHACRFVQRFHTCSQKGDRKKARNYLLKAKARYMVGFQVSEWARTSVIAVQFEGCNDSRMHVLRACYCNMCDASLSLTTCSCIRQGGSWQHVLWHQFRDADVRGKPVRPSGARRPHDLRWPAAWGAACACMYSSRMRWMGLYWFDHDCSGCQSIEALPRMMCDGEVMPTLGLALGEVDDGKGAWDSRCVWLVAMFEH